jgi:cholesterol oxidase
LRAHAFRAVARRLPAVAMLDDHEVADNWEPGRPVPAAAALRAYRLHQHKLAPQVKAGRAPPALHHRFHPAGFPVFLLDARSARQARVLRGEQGVALDDARIVPDATLAALAQWLDSCPKDAPKFIASPSVVLPLERCAVHGDEAERLGLDSWSGFPASLSALLQLVARGRHQHVVFLSGDAHLSLVCSLDVVVDGQRPVCVHSVVSSGLYAPWPFANSPAADLLLDGDMTFRHRGAVAFSGTMTTAAIGTAQGFARVDVRRLEGDAWQMVVELDLDDGTIVCQRLLNEGGPPESWQVHR